VLDDATRIDIIGTAGRRVLRVDDRLKIHEARKFIGRFPDGWIERWSGPSAPEVDFWFYKNDQMVGNFGIGSDYLTFGTLYHRCSPEEIARLAATLGLKWPAVY
jgi:hypothetical protein